MNQEEIEHKEHGSVYNSFYYAFRGIKTAFKNEKTFRVQVSLAVLAIAGGCFFNISSVEWLVILITIALVLSLELVNTQVERLIDHLHPENHPEIGIIKDVMAAAVLISSIIALVIAAVVFLPKFLYI